jgi:hypothetical protein
VHQVTYLIAFRHLSAVMSAHPIADMPAKGSLMVANRTTRRLRDTIIFAVARGAATAAGSGLVGLAFWWLTHH